MRAETAIRCMILPAVLYVLAALLVFNLRHPWATEIECWRHLADAVLFRSVPYDEMRPR